MGNRLNVVQNDTAPAVVVSLTNAFTGAPIDISTATLLQLVFFAAGSTTVLDTLTGSAQPGFLQDDGTLITNGYTTPGSGGLARFPWNANTLKVPPGEYLGSVKITYSGGAVQTVPQYIRFFVRGTP
ncbi:MAG: hypothetical protein ACXWCO_00730 [Caldimonas sp.]